MEYERVLLQLDWIHGDDTPALDTAGLTDDRDVLYAVAEFAIEELADHAIDALQVELVLRHARRRTRQGRAVMYGCLLYTSPSPRDS